MIIQELPQAVIKFPVQLIYHNSFVIVVWRVYGTVYVRE